MKLRNKKTGEIVDIANLDFTSDAFCIWLSTTKYNSLAELNAEWEDYEEPKEYWYLENDGDVDSFRWDGDDYDKRMMLIGNCFSSKEEAEKAVEKLKAWKRLKDKGFRFNNFIRDAIYYEISDEEIEKDVVRNDLDLLFGGEK